MILKILWVLLKSNNLSPLKLLNMNLLEKRLDKNKPSTGQATEKRWYQVDNRHTKTRESILKTIDPDIKEEHKELLLSRLDFYSKNEDFLEYLKKNQIFSFGENLGNIELIQFLKVVLSFSVYQKNSILSEDDVKLIIIYEDYMDYGDISLLISDDNYTGIITVDFIENIKEESSPNSYIMTNLVRRQRALSLFFSN